MNKSNIEADQPGQKNNNEQTAQNQQVSQPNANTNVVGSLFESREIRFRFWLGHIGKMTYSHSLSEVGKIIPDFTEDIIPLQYTGLKDKNGKGIYEGDIVTSFKKPYEDVLSINKVEFKKGGWSLVCKGKNDIPLFLYNPEHLKVTGNIFENPELLQTLR